MNRFACCVLLLAALSCNNSNNKINMNGAYSMITQSFKGSAIDTTFTQHRQLKIYADSFMMYVRVNPADGVSAFGVGTFSIDSGKLTENIMYSATDSLQNTNTFSGTVNIIKNDTGYEQVIPKIMSDKGEIKLTEEYKSVGTAATSPLDGAWKQVSSYVFRGNNSVKMNDVEYKTFYAGNFTYGDYFTDSLNKKHTGISYGTFALDNNNHLKETITQSTWPAITGKTFELDITLNTADSFTEKKTNANIKEVSVYERLKK
jgi:hypothetical protein